MIKFDSIIRFHWPLIFPDLETILQKVYELVIEISQKITLLLIIHLGHKFACMSWQVSYHDMCKMCTDLIWIFHITAM